MDVSQTVVAREVRTSAVLFPRQQLSGFLHGKKVHGITFLKRVSFSVRDIGIISWHYVSYKKILG